ncbi:hypothetical protein [Actinoallomurus sp. NPDC052274]|uniref:hypothetical protein n=1 Tax=Actinoallomurus sp. NPDC052274 TaxID=3155420 RepID=UPI0034326D57
MSTFPDPPDRRFTAMFAALLRRVTLLETRTAGIDSGTRIQTITGTVDPAYSGGQPKVTLAGDTSLSGPYQRIASYTPGPGDLVLMLPLGATYVVAGKLI